MYNEISFPGLGLSVNPSRVACSIGGMNIYWYGIIIAAGFLLAVVYGVKRCRQFGLTQDNILDMLIFAVPLAIICARAYYCIFEWGLYKDDLLSVLDIRKGGLAIYGGVIGAVLGVFLFSRVRKVRMRPVLDLGGLGLLIGQSIGRWGNFMNREAFGGPCTNFLRMGLTDDAGTTIYVHPTFFYESAWNALGLLILHFASKKRKYDGQVFLWYLAWYGLGRMVIEGMRTDSLYIPNTNLRVSQLLAGCCVVVAVVVLLVNRIFRTHDPDDLYVNVVAARAAAQAAPAEAPVEAPAAETAADQDTQAPENPKEAPAPAGQTETQEEAPRDESRSD